MRCDDQHRQLVTYCARSSDTFVPFGWGLTRLIRRTGVLPLYLQSFSLLQYSMSLVTYLKAALIKYQENGGGERGVGVGGVRVSRVAMTMVAVVAVERAGRWIRGCREVKRTRREK